MSAPRGSVFRYREYAMDAEPGVLTCRYELDGREFTERVTLSPGERWHTGQARAAARRGRRWDARDQALGPRRRPRRVQRAVSARARFPLSPRAGRGSG